ncbi:TIGR03643 family protein [Psychrobacter sp. APC 3426]|nr:TIGR03643 family protein [Psychrobacter sp. APC 3426]MDN3397432.1 TIGR03643 family protein [Psychrobacter sp. APC 3426]
MVNSSLAIMQADMQIALENKQHADINVNTKSEQQGATRSSNNIAQSFNKAGESLLDDLQVSRVIEMAWEDRTPFEAIKHSYGLDETAVIKLMRQALKPSSFRLWRQRVTNRVTKHQAKRPFDVGRAYCKTQYKQR